MDFLTILNAGSSRWKYLQRWFSVGHLFLACRWSASHSVLIGLSFVCVQREREVSRDSSFSYNFFLKTESRSVVSNSLQPIQSREFSRPEYWSGQPFPSPGSLPNPGIKPRSPSLHADYLPAEPPGKPKMIHPIALNQHSSPTTST